MVLIMMEAKEEIGNDIDAVWITNKQYIFF